ncbi:DUF2550 family protein [Boudabousia marimammalium]|uniref:DUF2550 domain-containing protein n=1 Tax=Boudabousia marimammalium TaxID=156892 RepID=A0A1Q5PRN9_9ACTO|nr:DUF2550 family protein [Boudabousia marimammalium]OKL50159.1 hypothetical protein BM477_01825 [Boudabousia marimammalium]
MEGALWFFATVGVLSSLAIIVGLILLYFYRVRMIARRVGSFELALHLEGESQWTSGIGLYSTDSLEWHRTVSLSLRPKYRFRRGTMLFSDLVRREGSDVVEVRVVDPQGVRWLAMHESSYRGLVSWVDSAPPVADDIFADSPFPS